MRFETICSLDLFLCLTRIVCFTSLTDGCIVTCKIFFRLYCWRVRSFRFFCLTIEFNYCWVIIADKSNCGEACDINEIAENNLALDSTIITLISSLKLFIIACRTLIVTDVFVIATWFEWSNWSAIDNSLLALRLYLENIRLLKFDY